MRQRIFALACLGIALAACQRAPLESARVVPQVGPAEPKRVSFSPTDNHRLLVMEASGRVGVWDILPSSQQPQLFASIAAGAIDATFSPDGRSLATVGTDGRLRWWSADGQLEWVSQGGHRGPARAVAIAPELIATGGEDGVIRLWQHDGTPLGEIPNAHDGPIMSLAVSPRGDLASLGGDEVLRLWKRVHRAATPGAAPTFEAAVLYQPQQRRYPQGFMGLLRLDTSWGWDRSVAFSPTGDVLVAVLFDGSLRLWNADGTVRAAVSNAHQGRHVRAVSFSPRGDLIASGGWDGTLRLWDLTGSPRRDALETHLYNVFSVAFSADGIRLATTGFDNAVRVWNVDGSRELELPSGDKDGVTAVALAADAPLLAAAYQSGALQLWNLDGSPVITSLEGHQGFVQALAFSAQRKVLASAGSDGTIRFWNFDGTPRGMPSKYVKTDRLFVKVDLVFSPRGDALAVGVDPFQLWNEDRLLWERPLRPADAIRSIAFSPGGDFIVTGSALGDIEVWNLDGSARVGPLKQRTEYTAAVAMAPGGDYFAAVVGASPTVTLFNLDGTLRGAPLEQHFGAIRSLAFAPDGRLVSGGDDGVARLWTLPSGQVQTIDVGLPIDQLGFRGGVLWVRANRESVFFYAPNGTPLATMLLRRDAAVIYTRDGWYAGAPPTDRLILFDASGRALKPAEAASHMMPSRVMQALTDFVS